MKKNKLLFLSLLLYNIISLLSIVFAKILSVILNKKGGVFSSFFEKKNSVKNIVVSSERVAPTRYSLFFPIFASASSSAGRADVKIKRTFLWGLVKGFDRTRTRGTR